MEEYFPDDENGDVLRRMKGGGDNFSISRNIDFTVVFPDQDSAEQFAERISSLGYRSSINLSNCVAELPWDVAIVKQMLPSHGEITFFEGLLASIAAELGGRNDGWGCFRQQHKLSAPT